MSATVQIDLDATRMWSRGWLGWSDTVRRDRTRLIGTLDELQIASGWRASDALADVSGDLLRSSAYLAAVANAAEVADLAAMGSTLHHLEAAMFGAFGALQPGAAVEIRHAADVDLRAAVELEAARSNVEAMSGHELADYLLALPTGVRDRVLALVDDATFGELASKLDHPDGGWLVGASRRVLDQVLGEPVPGDPLIDLGKVVSLDVWRRFGEHVEWIDPDPSTARPDSARDDPARSDMFERLRYADFSHWSLHGDGETAPDPSRFRQGSIGDCYLIAAMITLGREDADGLAGLVAPNPNGTFTVTFADGTEQVVSPDLVVDPLDGEELPNGTRRYEPVFASSDPGGVLFPALVEKAYAQANGGYGEIVGGSSSEAIEVLTGRPGGWIDDDDIDIDDLAERWDAGESLGLSTIDRPDDMTNSEWKAEADTPEPFKNSFGGRFERLHQNHAFIVTDVDAAAGTVSVINPWDPSQPAFELTEDELRESVNGVRTNVAP